MTRKAIVAAVGESCIDLLSLDEVERAHDEACTSATVCGSSGCGCRVSGRPFKAAVPKSISVKAGDTVEVSASAGGTIGASFIVLGLPLAGAIGGWFVIRAAFPGAGEGIFAAGASGGLLVTAGLTVALGGRRRDERLPEIIAVTR